jgi:GTP cyclohydrolase I
MTEIKLDDNFDFGFTTHAGEEFVDVDEARAMQNKAEAMYEAILPLLNNLAKDADKNEMIRWPNRAVKIYEFRKRLEEILNS